MRDRKTTILISLIILTVAGVQAGVADSVIVSKKPEEIRYSYPNDLNSSLSIYFRNRRPPLLHDEEWIIMPCVTSNPYSFCDYDTTVTSTRAQVIEALSHSMAAFQKEKPNATLEHFYISAFITPETHQSLTQWISPAKTGKDKRSRSKLLQERLRTFTFEPLKTDLNIILSKYGYRISNAGYAPEKVLLIDPDDYLEYLANEHSPFYLELERLEEPPADSNATTASNKTSEQ